MSQTFDTRGERDLHDEYDRHSRGSYPIGRWLRVFGLCAVLGGCVVNPVPTPATGGYAVSDASAAMDGGATDAAVGGSDSGGVTDTSSSTNDASASDSAVAGDAGLPGDVTASDAAGGDVGLSDDATQSDAD